MDLKRRLKGNGTRAAIVAACFTMVFVSLGFCSSNKSIYLAAITQALGIKRSLFSINDSCRYIATAAVNLFFGRLIGRFHAKKLVCAGFICLIISMLIYASASTVAVFCIGGIFLGVGLSWTTTTMVSYLVARWFSRKRGTVSGLILCANGLGGAAAAQILTPIIYAQGDLFGYRKAYILVAVLLFAVGILVTALIREPAEDMAPEGPGVRTDREAGCGKKAFHTAREKRYFFLYAVCIFLTGISLQGINGISAAHLGDVGIRSGFIAAAFSIHSLTLSASKFLAGFGCDRFGLKKTLLICCISGVLAFTALLFSGPGSFGNVCVIAWAVLFSIALPLETVMVPLITLELFGRENFSKLLGLSVSFITVGFALGNPVANLIYDVSGTYRPVLITCVFLMLAVLAGFRLLLKTPVRNQETVL